MKKSLLTLAALMLLALGSLAMSSDQGKDENCPPCPPCDQQVCKPNDSCPIPCPK